VARQKVVVVAASPLPQSIIIARDDEPKLVRPIRAGRADGGGNLSCGGNSQSGHETAPLPQRKQSDDFRRVGAGRPACRPADGSIFRWQAARGFVSAPFWRRRPQIQPPPVESCRCLFDGGGAPKAR
jgi:hypothetical protein